MSPLYAPSSAALATNQNGQACPCTIVFASRTIRAEITNLRHSRSHEPWIDRNFANGANTIVDPYIDRTHLSTRHVMDQSDRSICTGRGSRCHACLPKCVTGRKVGPARCVWVRDSRDLCSWNRVVFVQGAEHWPNLQQICLVSSPFLKMIAVTCRQYSHKYLSTCRT